jgi:hypothetical protein
MGQDQKLRLPDVSTRFLVELDGVCSIYRVYGADHPTFRRHAQAAAEAVESPLELAITPNGFSHDDQPSFNEPDILRLSQRLRVLGLVSLHVTPGLTAAQVEAAVRALDEAERAHQAGEAVADTLARQTDNRLRAGTLKLASLQLVEGAASSPIESKPVGVASAIDGQIANAGMDFNIGSSGLEQWKALVDDWRRELAEARKSESPSRKNNNAPPRPLHAAASFLQKLSPPMCQQLLANTIGDHAQSPDLVLSLAQGLPTGTVLGALGAASKTTGGASAAALTLLRRCSLQLTGQDAGFETPITNEQVAEAAANLAKLLGADREGTFVPTDYLVRREELSRSTAATFSQISVQWPEESETIAHAAQILFQILSTPNASEQHLISALEHAKIRMRDWLARGQFSIAMQAVALAEALSLHEKPAIAKSAAQIVQSSICFEDLLAGWQRNTDRDQAARELAKLFRQGSGSVLAGLFASAPAEIHAKAAQPIVNAVARAAANFSEQSIQLLFSMTNGSLPALLLVVLDTMPAEQSIALTEKLLSAAPALSRLALVERIFAAQSTWPVTLIERLLKDNDRAIRRLAAMRLARDADLSAAAAVLHAASGTGEYEPDVGVFLAELLHRHRRDPAVRQAYRQWWWSARRWAALFSWRADARRQAG